MPPPLSLYFLFMLTSPIIVVLTIAIVVAIVEILIRRLGLLSNKRKVSNMRIITIKLLEEIFLKEQTWT